MLIFEFSNRQATLQIDTASWKKVLSTMMQSEGIPRAEISVAIVSDAEIHQLNRQYLSHDYPTDVLSFVLDRSGEELIGEIIVSADTALERCSEFCWSPEDELTLYLIHGALHLVGYKDKSAIDRGQMRDQEVHYLHHLGIGIQRRLPDETTRRVSSASSTATSSGAPRK